MTVGFFLLFAFAVAVAFWGVSAGLFAGGEVSVVLFGLRSVGGIS